MGRTRIQHTRRLYRVQYRHNRYRVSSARLDEIPEFGTARQLAYVLGLVPSVVYRWIDAGLPAERAGRGPYRLQRTDVIEWMQAQGFVRDRRARGEYD
jgi:excisionase family DNA binding protein